MYKAYKFRLYSNTNQEIFINKTFGCYRFVYNYFLDKCKNEDVYKNFFSKRSSYPVFKNKYGRKTYNNSSGVFSTYT